MQHAAGSARSSAAWRLEIAPVAPSAPTKLGSRKAITKPAGCHWDAKTVPKAVGCLREAGGLTIEDGTSEEAQELDEQVLLLGRDFVPAESLPAALDFAVAETLLDVGLEHFLGHNTGILVGSLLRVAGAPELEVSR